MSAIFIPLLRRTAALLTAALLVAVPGFAKAATVQLDGTTATGVEGLVLDGQTYNVAFQFDSFDDLVGSGGFICLGSPLCSSNAVNAINDALNLTAADSVGPSAALNSADFRVPNVDTSPTNGGRRGVFNPPSSEWAGPSSYTSLNNQTDAMFATFATVPVPPAVWLFVSALGLLGWIRPRCVSSRQTSSEV